LSFIKKTFILIIPFLFLVLLFNGKAQPVDATTLYSKHTLQSERIQRRNGLYKYTILPLLKLQPDTNNIGQFQSALWAISQYMLRNDTTQQIVDTLFSHYTEIDGSTRRNLMEVVYGLYPVEYSTKVQQLWQLENDERVMAIMLSYLLRKDVKLVGATEANKWMMEHRDMYDSSEILHQVFAPLLTPLKKGAQPLLSDFFEHQKTLGCKIIYSLQRYDRNYPGLAIIQNADGSFVKDSSTGRLKTFVQLARSAANLPYYITNGSTPQGAYRIKGTAISLNNFIGPTPNIQLRMPYEIETDSFFISSDYSGTGDTLLKYKYINLLPKNWHNADMMESYYAGKCGRGAIIAHGTTIDPWYYRQTSFYPSTPTLGCLCAKEIWNPNTGKLIQSDQLNMVNAFLSTPGTDGYLYVINIDTKKTAVMPEEIETLVKAFESKK
jgi:hypothetical protein